MGFIRSLGKRWLERRVAVITTPRGMAVPTPFGPLIDEGNFVSLAVVTGQTILERAERRELLEWQEELALREHEQTQLAERTDIDQVVAKEKG